MNYGAPLAAVSTAVPEPATWIVLMLGMAAMLLRRDVVVSHSPALPKKALKRLWGTV